MTEQFAQEGSSAKSALRHARFAPITDSRKRDRGAEPIGGTTKRVFDVAIALIILVLLSPLLLMTVILVMGKIGRPILYKHRRVGFAHKEFECLKFRTMLPNSDEILRRHLAANPDARREWEEHRKLRNDPRVTAIGIVLRKTSLDELPQLLNVLRGEMSLVGPRPVINQELSDKYGPFSTYYVAARPGLTGLWQVGGRSRTSYEQRVQLDTNYVNNWSLYSDVAIILRTIPAVLLARGSC